MEKIKERDVKLDIIRSLAIFLVVLCHTTEIIYNMRSIKTWNEMSIFTQILRTTLYTLSRISVPLFLMLTGKLLLDRKFENSQDLKKFYIKKVLPLFFIITIWNCIYTLIYYVMNFNNNDLLKTFFQNIFFLRDVDFVNMWYMPKILGLYIAIPFFSIILKKFDWKLLLIPFSILFLSVCIIPNINVFLEIWKIEPLKFMIDVSSFGGEYGIYIFLGYYVGNKKILKKFKSYKLIIISLISLWFTTLFQMIMYKYANGYIVWYNFIGLYVLAPCVYELITRIKLDINEKNKKRIIEISKSSLGIFFVHIIIEEIIVRIFDWKYTSNMLTIFVLTILVWVFSRIIIKLCSKINFCKHYLFYIR